MVHGKVAHFLLYMFMILIYELKLNCLVSIILINEQNIITLNYFFAFIFRHQINLETIHSIQFDTLNFIFLVVIVVQMNRFVLEKILSLFLVLIFHICKHCVFGDQTIFLGHRVSKHLNKKQIRYDEFLFDFTDKYVWLFCYHRQKSKFRLNQFYQIKEQLQLELKNFLKTIRIVFSLI